MARLARQRRTSTRLACTLALAAALGLSALPALPAAATTTTDTSTAGAVVDLRSLAPLPIPDLADLDDEVRQRLAEQRQAATIRLAELQAEAAAGGRIDTSEAALAFARLGALYFLYDRPAAALPALGNAARLQPTVVRWPYLVGYVHQTLGQGDAAAASYRAAEALDPGYAPLYLRRGELALAAGYPTAAAEVLRRALELDADCALCTFLLAQAEAELGRPEEAVRLYRQVLAAEPAADQVYYPLGLALRDSGDLEAAEESLGRVGDTPPSFADPALAWVRGQAGGASSHFVNGRRALEAGDLETALAEFRQGVESNPTDVPLRRALGLALRQSGQPGEAVTQYLEAVKLEPAEPLNHKELGTILLESGRLAEAARAFSAALELDPDFAAAHLGLGLAYARAGQPARALPHLDRAAELAPEDTDIRYERAMQLAAGGRVEDAVEELRRVVAATGHTGARLNLGILLEMRGAAEEARRELARVAADADAPRAARAQLALGRIAERAGDLEDARRRYRAVLEVTPGEPRAEMRLASLAAAGGDLATAAAGYARVLEAQPTEREARLAHATSLMLLGRDAEAAASLRAGLEAMPEDPFLSYQLALLLAASPAEGLRDGARALELARAAYAAAPTALHSQALVLAHAASGDFDAAVRAQARSLSAWPAGDPGRAGAQARLGELRQGRLPIQPWSGDPRLLYRPTVPLPPTSGAEDGGD